MFEIGTLDQLADITMGQSPKGFTVSKDGKFPLLNGPTEFGLDHPKPVQFTNDPKRYAKKGDLLFCVRGSTGKMNWADREYAIGRGLAAIRPKEEFSKYFLQGSIEYFLKDLISGATGSVFSNVNKNQLHKMKCFVPNKKIIRVINDFFEVIHEKIQLQRKLNQTLEETANTLFKSWFLNFEPTMKKVNNKNTGLPDEIDSLFPNSLESSELGEIPKGWRVSKLRDIFDIKKGSTPSTKINSFWNPEKYFWISPKDLSHSNSIYITNFSRKISEEGIKKIQSGLCPPETLLMSSRAPIGYLGISTVDVSLGTGIFAILPNDYTSSGLSFFFIKNQIKKLKQLSIGTTFEEISLKIFENFKIVYPNKEILFGTKNIFDNLYKKIKINSLEIENLIKIRNILLPKIISGELNIPDKE